MGFVEVNILTFVQLFSVRLGLRKLVYLGQASDFPLSIDSALKSLPDLICKAIE